MINFPKLRYCIFGLSAVLLYQTAFATTAWNYSNSAGPQQWAYLDPAYIQCATGIEQSPINISTATSKKKIVSSTVYYNKYTQPWLITIEHGSITAQIAKPSAKNYLQWKNKKYQLIQFHFHQPSETQLNGNSYPLEAHFVNQNADGSLAVVAVFFKVGNTNPTIQTILDNVTNNKEVDFSIEKLLPKTSTFYNFNGSLTTPPCSENVQWFVMEQPLELSRKQLDEFKHYMPISNARPVQPLHNRAVVEFSSQANLSNK